MAQNFPPVPFGSFQVGVQVANIPVLLTAATTTNVYTVPASKRFVITQVVAHDPNGNASTATLNVGSVNTTANSQMAAVALTNLGTAAASTYTVTSALAAAAPILQGGDVVTIVPATAATGVTIQVDLIGYVL